MFLILNNSLVRFAVRDRRFGMINSFYMSRGLDLAEDLVDSPAIRIA